MDRKDFSAQQVKALRAHGVSWLEGLYVDEKYVLEQDAETFVSETGLLCLFRLVPRVQELPQFRGRWDEKADSVDVDILGASEDIVRLFTSGAGQYRGHHPKRVPGDQRKFEVDITVPGITVCKGVMSLNLLRGVSVTGRLKMSGSVLPYLFKRS